MHVLICRTTGTQQQDSSCCKRYIQSLLSYTDGVLPSSLTRPVAHKPVGSSKRQSRAALSVCSQAKEVGMHMKQGRYRGIRVIVDLSGLGDSLQGGVFQAALDLLCSLHRKILSSFFKNTCSRSTVQWSGSGLSST